MIKNKESIKINSLTEDQITTLMSLSGVKKYPMRVKCATMAWHTLDNAINRKEK
jgi:nitrogen fixation NifU-like protein